MPGINAKLTKIPLTFGLVLLAAVGLVRVATLGETNDPALREAVRAELLNDLGARTSKELASFDASKGDGVALAKRADPAGIDVHSTKVSKPLISFSSSENAVVLVEYSLPDGPRRSEYWLFEHSAAAGWRYRRETSSLSYYLNFL
jgi:hypothetical protein